MTRNLALALLALAYACRAETPSRRADSTTRAAAWARLLPGQPSATWRMYDGDGFTLRYPPDAVLEPAESHPSGMPGTAIRGPTIRVPVPPDVGPSEGPAYRLIVSRFPNSAGLTADQWVDSLRREANRQLTGPDSLEYLEPPDTVVIGSVRALRLRPFCGDCVPEELYVVGRDHVVVLSYIFDISVPGDHEAQRRVYNAMIGTFRWRR